MIEEKEFLAVSHITYKHAQCSRCTGCTVRFSHTVLGQRRKTMSHSHSSPRCLYTLALSQMPDNQNTYILLADMQCPNV